MRRDALLHAAALGAILGGIAGALFGLVAFGDRLLVPLYTMAAGTLAGVVLLAGTAAWTRRPRRRRRVAAI